MLLFLLLDHPNHKYTRPLFFFFTVATVSKRPLFVPRVYRFLPSFMVDSTCLLVVCLSVCVAACECVCAQSSLDYYDCEEEVFAPPGTPA